MKNTLKVFRALNNLTQDELAQRLGASRANVNAIEKGHHDPSLTLAFRMARLFGVRIGDLFIFDEEIVHAETEQNAPG
jgi:putative transcriptional regulator